MRKFLAIIVGVLVLTSCATLSTSKLNKEELGMNKQQIDKLMKGNHKTIIGARNTEYGVLESIEYTDKIYDTSYMFHFLNDRLDEWYREALPLPAPVKVIISDNQRESSD